MSSGARLIVVAADRADLYGEIAEMLGVEVEHIVHRHVNRRTGRRSSEFYESIFVWRKV
jgi:ribosomal protein S24E